MLPWKALMEVLISLIPISRLVIQLEIVQQSVNDGLI